MAMLMLEVLIRSTVLCVAAAIVLLALRRAAAAYRHLVCVAALCSLLALPAALKWMAPLSVLQAVKAAPLMQIVLPPAQQDLYKNAASNAGIILPNENISHLNPAMGAALPPQVASSPEGSSAFVSQAATTWKAWYLDAATGSIWLAGACVLLFRLLLALVRLRRLKSECREALEESSFVLVSSQVQTPLTWGICRSSVIVLPEALMAGDPRVRDSALRHERAHIARWDWAWNLLAEMVCSLCWFQPGAWWLRARLRIESERACDDAVVLSGVAGPDYAAHLLYVAKAIGRSEVAPAMAQTSGGLDKRVRLILDEARSRRTGRAQIGFILAIALAVFALPCVRVAAKQAARSANYTWNGDYTSATAAPSPDLSTAPAAAYAPLHRNADVSPAPPVPVKSNPPGQAPIDTSLAIPLDRVTWGEAKDGLAPGMIITSPGPPNGRQVPFNSRIFYKVLVRNVTKSDCVFEFMCSRYGPNNSHPYLVPHEYIHDSLAANTIPDRFYATGFSDEAMITPVFAVKLSAGEAVVIPGDWDLYIGDDKYSFPRVESAAEGANWIVLPIKVRRLSGEQKRDAEGSIASTITNPSLLTVVDSAGSVHRNHCPLAGGSLEGKLLYAKIQIQIGTAQEHASEPESSRNNSQTKLQPLQNGVAWGPVLEGLQLGMRTHHNVNSFSRLSQAQFEVVLANRTSKEIKCGWMGYPTISQFSPQLFTRDGKPIVYVQTIAGPYMDQATDLAPGQRVVLGTISLPAEESTVLDAHTAGNYIAQFGLTVTRPNHADQNLTCKLPFMVSGSAHSSGK